MARAAFLIFTLFLVLSLPCNSAQAQTETLSIPHINLQDEVNTGINLEQNNNHIQAIEFYNADIAEKKADFGPFTQHLIHPLTGLARSYFALGNYATAQSSIRYAQHLTHRFDGVLSLNQREAIDLLTHIYLGQGLPRLANQQQVFGLSLAERNFAPDSMALLPALHKITAWYQATGQLNKATRSLQRSTAIIQAQADRDDLLLIPYLVQQAKIKRLRGTCCGQNILIQAIKIIESAPPINLDTENQLMQDSGSNTELKALLYAELADAYTTADKQAKAEKAYKLAWHNMTDSQREVQFSKPQKIAMAKRLNRLQTSPARLYQNRIGGVSGQISPRRQLASLPPQDFVLPLSEENYTVRIKDSYSATATTKDYLEVVGKPFQFIKKQVVQILPHRWQPEEQLAQLEVELSFTVNKTGKLSNIQILHSNSPAKLNRLMQQVLRKTRMRPRMIAGELVETRGITLNQTFK